jgi:DHA2 family multidrug resistance protein
LKVLRRRHISVDYIGLGLIAIGVGALQVVLDKGERDDWFASNFILITSILAGVCIITALFWEYNHKNPVIDIRLFKNRNFTVSCVMMFTLGSALFGATVLIPQLVQSLMGYTAQDAGMVLSPGAIVIILMMPFIGKIVGKVDARLMIAFGFLVAGIGLFNMTSISLDMDFKTIMMMRVYQMMGVAFLFVPIQTMCYVGIPPEKNNNVSGMTNLARNMGGSIGISLVETLLSRRAQYHQTALSSHTSQYDPAFQSQVAGLTQTFIRNGMDHAAAVQSAYGRIYGLMQSQANLLAYIDTIEVFATVCLLVVPLAFLMKKNNAGRGPAGAH